MDTAIGHVNPNYVEPSSEHVINTVLAERWDVDITTKDGFQRFMAVINDVRNMAAAL
jgi:hypothetical protein